MQIAKLNTMHASCSELVCNYTLEFEESIRRYANKMYSPIALLDKEKTELVTELSSIVEPCSISSSTTRLSTREVDIGMHNTHMTSKSIIPAECLFLGAVLTSNLLLAIIVNGILVTCEIVWS